MIVARRSATRRRSFAGNKALVHKFLLGKGLSLVLNFLKVCELRV